MSKSAGKGMESDANIIAIIKAMMSTNNKMCPPRTLLRLLLFSSLVCRFANFDKDTQYQMLQMVIATIYSSVSISMFSSIPLGSSRILVLRYLCTIRYKTVKMMPTV